jgi:hypothetical protein
MPLVVKSPRPAEAGQPGGGDVRALERKIDDRTNPVLELNRRVQELGAKQGRAPATRPGE